MPQDKLGRELLNGIPQYDGQPCEIAPQQSRVRGYAASNGKYMHREAALKAFGPSPQGKPYALHTCDNKPCIRSSHLFWGSPADNVVDMVAKNRHSKGGWATPKSPESLLTYRETMLPQTEKIKTLRAQGYKLKEIGKMVGLTESGVSRILAGNRRKIT